MLTTYVISGNLAEWLRRKIRNLLGFARAGSSPAVVVIFWTVIRVRKVNGIRGKSITFMFY